METSPLPVQNRSFFKPFVSIVLLAVAINLGAVNYVLYTQSTKQDTVPATIKPVVQMTEAPQAQNCDENCVRTIVKQATASIHLATPVPTKIARVVANSSSPTAPPLKELFVSLGSGQSASGDWSNVPGVSLTITSAQYGDIQSAYFQPTLSIPSTEGIVYARLYNATEGKPVANSDVSTTNSSPTLLTSQPISLDGTKLYTVQMKSTLMKDGILTQSRIKFIQK